MSSLFCNFLMPLTTGSMVGVVPAILVTRFGCFRSILPSSMRGVSVYCVAVCLYLHLVLRIYFLFLQDFFGSLVALLCWYNTIFLLPWFMMIILYFPFVSAI